jgi:glucan phosphoethanolaminetransferase (alkaline phosphatase superfamily)
MKHFKKLFTHPWAVSMVVWLLPIFLLVPNLALAVTEQDYFLAKITDIVLMCGIYYLIMSASKNVGRSALLCIPFMFFAAFQIVLLQLYGESIIAIDMYLNLVTTNPAEAGELLGNLSVAIAIVCVFYVPAITYGIGFVSNKIRATDSQLKWPKRIAHILTPIGLILLGISYIALPDFDIARQIFPANVVDNMMEAIKRTKATNNYAITSADFSHQAVSSRADSIPEIYVLVIGETSRADNWQLFGYNRPTNPRLSKRNDIVFYPKTLSESNITHKSVPLLLSHLNAENYGDSIYKSKSIISAFKQAGYSTAWLSNQVHNRSFIDFFSEEADTIDFFCDRLTSTGDLSLVGRLKQYLANDKATKKFIVLHTYGSHFNYRERYPAEYSYFRPDSVTEAKIENRQQLMNAYDNSIRYTDALLDSIMTTLGKTNCRAAMLYMSDHGEDIFDDNRNRFLHASPTPTYWQLHVPMVLWTSQAYREAYPEKVMAAQTNANKNVSSSRTAFDTLLSLAGISSPYSNRRNALTESAYAEPPRHYLNDYNECTELRYSGLKKQDFEIFDKNYILYK